MNSRSREEPPDAARDEWTSRDRHRARVRAGADTRVPPDMVQQDVIILLFRLNFRLPRGRTGADKPAAALTGS